MLGSKLVNSSLALFLFILSLYFVVLILESRNLFLGILTIPAVFIYLIYWMARIIQKYF